MIDPSPKERKKTCHLLFPLVVRRVHREEMVVQSHLRPHRLLRRNPRNVTLRPNRRTFRRFAAFRLPSRSRRISRTRFRRRFLGKVSKAADELGGGCVLAALAVDNLVAPHGGAAVLEPDHLIPPQKNKHA